MNRLFAARPVTIFAAASLLALGSAGLGMGASAASASTLETNDSATSVTYSSGWGVNDPASGYFDQDVHYTATVGATAMFAFSGTSVSWIGAKNADHGQASVAVCDASGASCGTATTVDTWADRSIPQQTLFTASGLSAGAHTLKITVLATTSHSGHYTDIDAFMSGTPATLASTYYINNKAGSNCSNAGPGTSTSQPWCDFTNLNGQTFSPGAQILLARGATFMGQLGRLYGQGISSAPITLGAYGTGARPHIQASGQVTDRVVWIEDASWWNVRDLELSNGGAGLVFWYNSNGHTNVTVDNVEIHHIVGVYAGVPRQNDLYGMFHSAGLLITGYVPETASDTAVSNVTVTRYEAHDNNDDFDISGFNPIPAHFMNFTLFKHSVSNVRLSNSYFHDSLSGSNFNNLNHMTITGLRMENTGTFGNPNGTCAMFFWDTTDVTVSNSILAGEKNSGSPDQSEVDLEAMNDRQKFYGNVFANPAGEPLEVLYDPTYMDQHQTNHEFTDNLFYGYGYPHYAVFNGVPAGSPNFSGVASNNLYYASGSLGFSNGFPGWTVTNNLAVGQMSTYSAAFNYATSQGVDGWRFEYKPAGGNWSDIGPYDTASDRWGTGGNISRFDIAPDDCSNCVIARDWVAPSAGPIAIRSRVLKDELGGDGVTVRITNNGTQIWPATGGAQSLAGTDNQGYSADADVTVAAGDHIRFEVTNGGAGNADFDATAWAPLIAYK